MPTGVVNWAELHPVQGLVRPPPTHSHCHYPLPLTTNCSPAEQHSQLHSGRHTHSRRRREAEEVIVVDTTSRGCDSFEAPHDDTQY